MCLMAKRAEIDGVGYYRMLNSTLGPVRVKMHTSFRAITRVCLARCVDSVNPGTSPSAK